MTIGQISTSGRLEVTALGDEMNEAARIEHTATGGTILASKGLVERLEPDDAELLGLEPDRLVYRKLSSFEAPDKAVRDAGNVAVVEIRRGGLTAVRAQTGLRQLPPGRAALAEPEPTRVVDEQVASSP